ncbi:Down-regulator of transcription 1 [Aphelenchoides fujianensis]|nr:Down-regulator of transcription 1 [Aphelenchoides fujianensis]
MADDEEVGLPQKGLNQIIKDVLPDVRIANESRELLNQCCVEFVKHVAREAQRISAMDQRKTIYHEHVQKALQNLGFPAEYTEAANSVLNECKIAAEKRLKRKNSRLDKCGIPEEELYLMQQELIAKARREEAEKQAAQQTDPSQAGIFTPPPGFLPGPSSSAGGLMLPPPNPQPAQQLPFFAASGQPPFHPLGFPPQVAANAHVASTFTSTANAAGEEEDYDA